MELELMEGYKELCALITKRVDGASKLDRYLGEKTSWLTAPASSFKKFHCCFEGGLIAHSMNVTRTLLSLRDALMPSISDESCAIVGLYHDCGKVGSPGNPMYIPQESDWHRRTLGQLYKVNEEGVFLDVPTRSLNYILRFVNLTDEEVQAIRYHDGQYVDENKPAAMKEQPLTRLLHMADSWSAGVIEKEGQK